MRHAHPQPMLPASVFGSLRPNRLHYAPAPGTRKAANASESEQLIRDSSVLIGRLGKGWEGLQRSELESQGGLAHTK